jgi:hypothetical protein
MGMLPGLGDGPVRTSVWRTGHWKVARSYADVNPLGSSMCRKDERSVINIRVVAAASEERLSDSSFSYLLRPGDSRQLRIKNWGPPDTRKSLPSLNRSVWIDVEGDRGRGKSRGVSSNDRFKRDGHRNNASIRASDGVNSVWIENVERRVSLGMASMSSSI